MRFCPRCRRANPDEASYCHHDGIALISAFDTAEPQLQQLEWTFSNGRRCHTVDELASACLAEWDEACTALTSGEFRDHFERRANPELARAAANAMEHANENAALQAFLDNLPESTVFVRPVVDPSPRRLNVEEVRLSEVRLVPLRLINHGQGYLQGTISVAEGEHWLSIGDGETPARTRGIGTRTEQEFMIRVDPARLPGPGSYLARIRIESNGGNLEVPVQANLVNRSGAFMGYKVHSEREFGKLLRDHSRDAVAWLQDGRAKRFYLENGWTYPLKGEIAPNVAGIQQFFEASGFAQPPELWISATEVQAVCIFPETITRTIELATSDKKWVYAFVESDDMWLKPTESVVAGPKSIEVRFEIDSGLLEPGQVRDGLLKLTANGDQAYFVTVRVVVRRRR